MYRAHLAGPWRLERPPEAVGGWSLVDNQGQAFILLVPSGVLDPKTEGATLRLLSISPSLFDIVETCLFTAHSGIEPSQRLVESIQDLFRYIAEGPQTKGEDV